MLIEQVRWETLRKIDRFSNVEINVSDRAVQERAGEGLEEVN
jgi:hypothetical protein